MKKLFGLFALIFLFSVAAFADVRLETPTPKPEKTPKQVKSIDTELSINLRSDAKEARLIIPKSQIRRLRAELAQLDADESDEPTALSFSKTQTIVSGLFLSLAFVFGGVWFARSRGKATKTGTALVVGAVLFLSGAFAAIAFANVGAPVEARSVTGKMFSDAVHQYKYGYGKIKLETSDTGDYIQLIVPDPPKENKPNNDE